MGKQLNDPSIPLGFNTVDNTYYMSIVHPTTGKIFKLNPSQFIALYGGQLNKQTGSSYTASLADANGVIEMNNGSANTVTIPPNSSVPYPIGTQFAISQYGAGQTSILAGSGVTIRNIGYVTAQFGQVFLYKRATDEWVMSGGTSSSLTTPPAPTAGTVNDTTGIDTFDWTNSAGYSLVSDYEYTLDGGSTYSALTAKPLVVGDVNKAIGQVGVRVKAHTGTTVSSTLYNASAFTASGGGTTLTAPVLSTPSIISSTELDLLWTDPNTSPNESSFELQTSPDNSTWSALATPAANATTYNNTGLSAGTLHYYRIRAVGNGTTTITSAWSNVVNATTSGAGINLAFAGASLTNTSNVYTVTGGGSAWNNLGLSGQKLRGTISGGVSMRYTATDAIDAFLGFNDAYVAVGYASMKIGFRFTSGQLQTNDLTNRGALTLGYYYQFVRNGSTGQIKIQSSPDNATWTDFYTTTYNSTAVLYPVCDINGGGKMYTPLGFNTVSAIGSNYAPSAIVATLTGASLTNNSEVYTVTGGGTSYGNTAIAAKKLPSGVDGWIGFKIGGTDAMDAIMGFKTTNSVGGFGTMNIGFWRINTAVIDVVDGVGASAAPSGGSAAIGDFIRLNRVGTVIKLQKSVDDGTTWTDIMTVALASSADLFIDVDINGDGKLYYPQGIGIA